MSYHIFRLFSLVAILCGPAVASAQEQCADHSAQRKVYFGDLHIHTALSADAYVFGTRNLPDDAYRFARGDSIEASALFVPKPVKTVALARPLDFAAVTDHAEYLGASALCTSEDSPRYDAQLCRDYRNSNQGQTSMETVVSTVGRVLAGMLTEPICGADGSLCREAARAPWKATLDSAARWNSPCEFTAFVGYEHSASPLSSKVHRNVIFRSQAALDLPVSATDEPTGPGLWKALRAECIDAGNGCDALSIPHNSNLSNGQMFAVDYGDAKTPEEQAEVARLRTHVEPIVEMMQMKGDSECRNGMWDVAGGTDELCNFEKYRGWPDSPEDCQDGSGGGALLGQGCISRLDFVRYALIEGLRESRRIGANPFKFGFIGSTDAHDGTAGDTDEWVHDGVQRPVARVGFGRDNPGGLAAVWAEENTRQALFDAMRRRETYATSGPRMTVRFFGGWNFAENSCAGADLVGRGYAQGVPMGGDLPERPTGAKSPTFVVSALRDPGTAAHPGGLLQRVQIIKGWVGEDGLFHQAVFEAAGDSSSSADVNLETCEPRGAGAESLCGVWQDPSFDAEQAAVYYARVLENPSCRSTTRICRNLPADKRPAACDSLPQTIQERAWTAPIWYEPKASGSPSL
ncbi:DUF3604 domain-containing protein [Myxococcota bacterium]|nr:DUF3604 domain-containing protein [Myxococcota bacterium]